MSSVVVKMTEQEIREEFELLHKGAELKRYAHGGYYIKGLQRQWEGYLAGRMKGAEELRLMKEDRDFCLSEVIRVNKVLRKF